VLATVQNARCMVHVEGGRSPVRRMKFSFTPKMQRLLALAIIALLWALSQYLSTPGPGSSPQRPAPQTVRESAPKVEIPEQTKLPAEVYQVLRLIESGGPFPYEKDGTTFNNREGRLPVKPKGYYKEYTVPTPHSLHRGARRLIRGGEGEVYYTDDHYRTFMRIVPP
jgi:ribonuclease T1